MKSRAPKVAYLGPEGTFAHFIAQKRFGRNAKMLAEPTIGGVVEAVTEGRASLGIVPIENSSGGTIFETVDLLVDEKNELVVREALSLNVRLALLGKDRKNIRIVYSHFAPLFHCEQWIREHLPQAELVEQASTAIAAQKAAATPNAAAIGNRDSARRYGLKVLKFPIEQDVKNVTQFFVLGRRHSGAADGAKTSIVFTLRNRPGSLYDFLTPFKKENVNLTRIISRPVIGKPETYIFLADLAGAGRQFNVKAALNEATALAATFRNIGSYPVRKAYDS
ncbi:MAG: prephenate dehydratase [Verrucomicrobia bacterium]|nr:prephenate dehydratase [Verrucomicrobiota bacterium]MDE3098409.1 prephenate dehydratase [Verrucomicrobiota bacterium]